MKRLVLSTLCFGLLACGGDTSRTPTDDINPEVTPEVPAQNFCEAAAPGMADTRPAALALSELHANQRFFGIHKAPLAVDDSLWKALSVASLDEPEALLLAYAEALGGGCILPAAEAEIPAVRIEQQGEVAWVRFGSGTIALSDEVTTVIVDLRDAPEGLALEGFLDEVSRVLLAAAPTPLDASVRVHDGMRDEAFSPFVLMQENLYDDSVRLRPLRTWSGDATIERKIGLRLGVRLAPTAARYALTLRAAGRAALLSQPVFTQVAESQWHAVGDYGHLQRVTRIATELGPIEEIVAADIALPDDKLAEALIALPELEPLTAAPHREGPRPLPNDLTPSKADIDDTTGLAAVIAFHGGAKRFFPYWDVVEGGFDDLLLEVTAMEDVNEDGPFLFGDRRLRMLSHGLYDSHGLVYNLSHSYESGEFGQLPLLLDETADHQPVVRLSADPEIAAGDILLEVDGEPVADKMERLEPLITSSDSSRFRNLARAILKYNGETSFRFQRTNGVVYDKLAQPKGAMPPPPFPARVSGTLQDLGASQICYLNWHGESLLPKHLKDAQACLDGSSGAVVDMRGYPGPAAWSMVARFFPETHDGASLVVYQQGPWSTTALASSQPWQGSASAYALPVAMLVGPSSQSAAEHLTLTMQAAKRVRVFGRPSAGANGNITGMLLPGGWAATFTGMVVLQPDGSTFHGKGVLVDELIQPTASEFAAGIDPELQAALAWLQQQP